MFSFQFTATLSVLLLDCGATYPCRGCRRTERRESITTQWPRASVSATTPSHCSISRTHGRAPELRRDRYRRGNRKEVAGVIGFHFMWPHTVNDAGTRSDTSNHVVGPSKTSLPVRGERGVSSSWARVQNIEKCLRSQIRT